MSAIDLSANDTATENSKVAAMEWLRHIEPVLTSDYRFIIQDIGQDPQDVLQVVCHLPVSDSPCKARSMYISCRDGDIAFALDRFSRAWAIAATPASERTSGFKITALSSIKREHLPDWLVFDGCLSSNGSPISRTGIQPLLMPYLMRLPNVLWRLRPSASGHLLDTHETSDGRRVSGVELMAAMMSCLAKDLVLEESKQMMITCLADGDSSQDTDGGNDAARHETAMKDLLALEQAFKTRCLQITDQDALNKFNSDTKRAWFADRHLEPSESVEAHRARVISIVNFVHPDEASSIEQHIKSGHQGLYVPQISLPRPPCEESAAGAH